MSIALQISCITRHYYPQTLDNLKKMCSLAGINAGINEKITCCGLPYFEKGELKAAKAIGEMNLQNSGHESLICASPKCHSVYTQKYPKIFNNTVSHNTAVHLAKNSSSLSRITDNLPDQFLQSVEGNFFLLRDCCSFSDLNKTTARMTACNFILPLLGAACCGAGTSMPSSSPSIAAQMSSKLIDEFLASGAEAMVFEDDICRKQVDIVALSKSLPVKTMNIIDLIMQNSQ